MSNNFSITDIHAIRYENYEQTKKLSNEELIKLTKEKALAGWQRIEQIRNDKSSGSFCVQ